MSIRRAPRPEANFTLILNQVLQDARLSYRARGVLVSILSRPDDWSTSAEQLAAEGSEGRDAIRTALSELEEFGYIQRVKVQSAKGLWATETVVFDTPQNQQSADIQEPKTGNQPSVNQPSDFQASYKQLKQTTTTSLRADAEKTSGPTAADLVAEWIEHLPNGRPPGQVVGQVAKRIGAMLTEGIPYADVRRGLQEWQTRSLHPSALDSVVHNVRTAQPRRPARQQETDDLFASAAHRLGVTNTTTQKALT